MFKKALLFVSVIVACVAIYFNLPPRFKKNDDPNTIRVGFINQWKGFTLDSLPMIKELFEERYANVIYDNDNYDVVISGPFGDKGKIKNKDAVKIYFTGEAVRPKIDKYDLSIGFDHIVDPKYIRVPLYYMYFKKDVSVDFNRGECNPNKPRFACFLSSNSGSVNPSKFDGCMARDRFFHKLSEYKKVHSGGKHLNNEGRVVPVAETMEWLGQCKFVIAYENETYEGYVTEKPFQAYVAGSLPIYYGTFAYSKDMNPNSIIYAKDFANEDDLVEYIKKVDNDNELYCNIWNNKMVLSEKQNYEAVKDMLRAKLYEVLDKKDAERTKAQK